MNDNNELAQGARLGFYNAQGTNPDLYADLRKVAQRTGVPVDTAIAMPDEMKKQDAMQSINFDNLAAVAPATAKMLTDLDKAKLTHDNIGNM